MVSKSIAKIVAPTPPHFVGDGFRVHNFIPTAFPMEFMDPFLLMDYNSKYHFPPTSKPRGVDVHPHRGFETVTIAYQGSVEHQDSHGGGGIIREGDVQWMTAASGVLHKEFHETQWSKKGGIFQMVQLWVNLSASNKMSAPKYQAIENKNIPKVYLADNKSYVEVIAGEYEGHLGAASTFSPIYLFNLRLQKGAEVKLNFPASYSTALLAIEGSATIQSGSILPENHLAVFKHEGEEVYVQANEEAVILVLSGQPLKESIASHGPFVMNTREELLQAFKDYQNGYFGHLE